jgi:Flp pilus assembly protein TadD
MKELFGRLSRTHRGVKPSTSTQAAAASPLTPSRLVEAALVHHRAGRLGEAEALYRKALATETGNFDALHMLGVLYQQNGESAKAVESIEQALAIAPGNHVAHSNLGLAYQALNRLDKAEASLRRAVALRPDWDRAHNNLGTVMQAAGQLADAEACFAMALQLNPSSAEALNNLGSLCKDCGQLAEAERFYRRALTIDSTMPETWKNLGQALQQSQRFHEAGECYQKALDLRPGDANVLNDIGTIHQARAELMDAERCFKLALQSDGTLVEAMCNLGDVLRRLDRLDEAQLYCRKALAIRPDDLAALNNLAFVLMRISALDEAEEVCRKALSIRRDDVSTHITMGCILKAREREIDAEACFLQALRLSPTSAPAAYNLSMLKLLRGDYKEGMKLYESRFDALREDIGCTPQIQKLLHDNRRWHGEALFGQRVLIWTEQGFGDSLMMLRYLPLLKSRGAGEVSILCEPTLERVVYAVSGLDHVIACTQSAWADEFDLHCPIMSLPFLFGTTVDSIPARVPYIAVPDELGHVWKQRLSSITKTKVGLAWAGSKTLRGDAARSIPLAAFEPVIRSEGVQLISLQKEKGAEQLHQWQGQMEDWMHICDDFMDTAALVDNLDLVISVDSAIVHLAGALGKPVWLLNRYGSEWRWGLESESSPWYPSMRIFRQREAGSWDRVIAQVADELTYFRPGQQGSVASVGHGSQRSSRLMPSRDRSV